MAVDEAEPIRQAAPAAPPPDREPLRHQDRQALDGANDEQQVPEDELAAATGGVITWDPRGEL